MEGPFRPSDPSQRLMGAGGFQSPPCRIDELARALKESAAIAEPRFSWITSEQLVSSLRNHGGGTIVVVDVREEGEVEGGHIPGAHRVPLHALAGSIDRLVALWRASKHLVVHCTRSLSRAPSAVQQLVRRIDQEGGLGAGRVPMVSVLEGGFIGYLEHVASLYHAANGPPAAGWSDWPLADFVSDFDPTKWVVSETLPTRLFHVSECERPPPAAGAGAAPPVGALGGAEDDLVSDELSFLVETTISLSGPSGGNNMPYIM
uniref:Rhodanese domain-containing protein n=1 Tax=Hemiselmis tepida TaxID=464990 RepID=A0A7S0YSL3_9CRYP|mmetsp:Transcript_23423/g.59225  ORF Transcript_23423/g.59225 Transcript_23423/m.59225 type:complete len:261 (+) Transcript_23423:210-992(+)